MPASCSTRGRASSGEFPHLEGTGEVVRYLKVADLAEARKIQPEFVSILKAWCDMKDAGGAA